MQTEPIQFDLIQLSADQITPEKINAKAYELGQAGARLLAAGTEMVQKAVELGALLETKAAQVERVGGNWVEWQEFHLEFSRQSADNYRKLFRNREAIANALAEGKINSIRQALAILVKEPGMEQPALPGMAAEKPSVPGTKTESIFSRLWRVFKEPQKAPEPERKAFILHTSEAVRVCRENGWELMEGSK